MFSWDANSLKGFVIESVNDESELGVFILIRGNGVVPCEDELRWTGGSMI